MSKMYWFWKWMVDHWPFEDRILSWFWDRYYAYDKKGTDIRLDYLI